MSDVHERMARHVTGTMHVASTMCGAAATLAVEGKVDRGAAARLEPLLAGICAAGATRIVVDLSRVASCDRALMRLLERIRSQVEATGGWLVLDGSPATMSGYDELPLDRVFRIYREACRPGDR